MELHCRYSLLLVLVGLLGSGVLGSDDGLRRLRREVFEVESDIQPSEAVEFGLRALKYEKYEKTDKTAKYEKVEKAAKHDKAEKYEKKEKSDKKEKSYKKEKTYKDDKGYATTRQVDIGGGVMMSMPLDVVMIDMSMSMVM